MVEYKKFKLNNMAENVFNQRMTDYKQTLAEQFAESHRLEKEILKQLNSLKLQQLNN